MPYCQTQFLQMFFAAQSVDQETRTKELLEVVMCCVTQIQVHTKQTVPEWNFNIIQ